MFGVYVYIPSLLDPWCYSRAREVQYNLCMFIFPSHFPTALTLQYCQSSRSWAGPLLLLLPRIRQHLPHWILWRMLPHAKTSTFASRFGEGYTNSRWEPVRLINKDDHDQSTILSYHIHSLNLTHLFGHLQSSLFLARCLGGPQRTDTPLRFIALAT